MNDNNAIVTMISIRLKAASTNLVAADVRSLTLPRGETIRASLRRLLQSGSDFRLPDLRSAFDEGGWTLDFRVKITADSLSRTFLVQKTTAAWSNYLSTPGDHPPPSEISADHFPPCHSETLASGTSAADRTNSSAPLRPPANNS